jgi:hypothetical protein
VNYGKYRKCPLGRFKLGRGRRRYNSRPFPRLLTINLKGIES